MYSELYELYSIRRQWSIFLYNVYCLRLNWSIWITFKLVMVFKLHFLIRRTNLKIKWINFFSYYIFSIMDGQILNKKFLSTMKIYILNSFSFCINDTTFCIVWIATAPSLYNNENIIFYMSPNHDFMFYLCYIYINISAIPSTFGVFMDIYIAYSRIQIFKPNLKLLLKTPVSFFKIDNIL